MDGRETQSMSFHRSVVSELSLTLSEQLSRSAAGGSLQLTSTSAAWRGEAGAPILTGVAAPFSAAPANSPLAQRLPTMLLSGSQSQCE